jgi:PRTRC genetic system protein B
MTNITELFSDIYLPEKALVIYRLQSLEKQDIYVEAYDINANGSPVNAHPLSIDESTELARALDTSKELNRRFLTPRGLLPEQVLYIDHNHNGCVIWHTPAREVNLFFTEDLTIPNGKAKLPPLLWKATKEQLYIYALKTSKKPDGKTLVYHAPFFNVHSNGNVCMGTVAISIENDCFLEDFISQWEHYFFESRFSHLIGEHNPVRCNIVQLWQEQINSKRDFPIDVLQKNGRTIKEIIR